jgi:hypothetical protein
MASDDPRKGIEALNRLAAELPSADLTYEA